MRRHVEARLAQRQTAIVEIQQVGIVAVYQVLAALVPLPHEDRIVERRILVPDPVMGGVIIQRRLGRLDAVGHRHRGAAVEFLRVQALPPFALAVILAELPAVIAFAGARAFGIVIVGALEPVPGMGGMVGNTELQAPRPRRLGPAGNKVALGAHARAVPGMEARIVVVEIVVMVGQCHEVFRAGPGIEINQLLGPPVLRLPQIVDLHEAGVGGMAVMLQVMLVLLAALHIHVAGVPVAGFRHALRRPVRPDAELGVAEPVRRLVLRRQRVPVGLEGAGSDGLRAEGGARQCRPRQKGRSGLQQFAFGQHLIARMKGFC